MDARPDLTIVLATIGRAGLPRAIASVIRQPEVAAGRVELLVVGDTHSGPLPEVERQAAAAGGRYVGHDGGRHNIGNPQRNAAPPHARGRWLAYLSDDDCYLPGSFGTILDRLAEAPPLPHLFRVVTPWRWPVWDLPRLHIGRIDAECIVAPNDPERLGRWSTRYEADFDFCAETVARCGGVVWCEPLIALCRPSAAEWANLWGDEP